MRRKTQRAIKRARRKLGISVLPHELRHGYATHCLQRGPVVPESDHGDPPTLAELGLTKKESAQAEQMAELKEEAPEALEEVRKAKPSLTKALRSRNREQAVKKAANRGQGGPAIRTNCPPFAALTS